MKSNKSNFFREIACLSVLNFFPLKKLIFWPFLKLQKMEFGHKIFREIDLFDFMTFIGLDFFKFSCPLWLDSLWLKVALISSLLLRSIHGFQAMFGRSEVRLRLTGSVNLSRSCKSKYWCGIWNGICGLWNPTPRKKLWLLKRMKK